ncbi:hypothetical protein RFI_02522 [Reticulomyxa filosa]|uniref:Uncharacterized protein n=1 Tax=Reticulomyxa filosa TaxID=46433 RepID=X6P8Y4_RETFI|nr:hypothetical protein RFI_02522 [Reticulomyxa filosa]|eukprot:ETO34573.1 hypothetical protein RFI_02522 [Reticulomyxa filosa]
MKILYQNLILPIKHLQLKYMPILIIYFSYGISQFLSIAEIFWIKNELNLSSVEVIQLSFWLFAPWTYKIIFAQAIERIQIFGSLRKSYIIIGALINFAGYIMLIGIANDMHWVKIFGNTYHQLLVAGILKASGYIIQDLIADTLCFELVSKTDSEGKPLSADLIKFEIGILQLQGKLILKFGLLISATIGGYLAANFSFSYIVWYSLLVPIFSLLSLINLNFNEQISKTQLNKYYLFFILLSIAISLYIEIKKIPFNQEIVFVINLLVVIFLIHPFLTFMDNAKLIRFLTFSGMIFIYRMQPHFGPAIDWWQIDVLQFNPHFFANLKQATIIIGVCGTWLLSSFIIKSSIPRIIIAFTIISTIFKLPIIGMAYGLHIWTEQVFGFGAKTIALIDTSLSSPFDIAFMASVWTFYTLNSPTNNRFTYFALVACLLNLEYAAAELLTKYLNQIYFVERGQYELIPNLTLSVTCINFILPILGVLFFTILNKKFSSHHLDKQSKPELIIATPN